MNVLDRCGDTNLGLARYVVMDTLLSVSKGPNINRCLVSLTVSLAIET